MKLPAFEDLSKEQDLIYNLDLDGNYLVSGPPGTGKSVMALYRAQALTIDDRQPAILMFSKVLCQYTEQAAKEIGVAGYVTTFHKWLWAFWRQHYRTNPATMTGSTYDPDWAQLTQKFLTNPPVPGLLTDLLVDEGQDLSLSFFRIARYVAKNITVFADENQQLHDHNTTLREIETGIGAREHLTLRRNYRNTAEIAAVAATYYAGAPTGIPETPTRHGDKPTLRRYDTIDDFVDHITRYVTARTNLTIGVACLNQTTQRRLYRALTTRNLPIPVQHYISRRGRAPLEFDAPAVTLINPKSLKGLEFDTLFVPELQQETADTTSAATRMKYYVVMSRARDELHLSWSGRPDTPDSVADLDQLVQRS